MASSSSSGLLDPKNDLVFKVLFTTAPQLLRELINAVRHQFPLITAITILNPEIYDEDLQGKFIQLDILAEDEFKRRYNIEMQVRQSDPWSRRSSYYLARTLTSQLEPGDDYALLQPVIGIHLLNFNLFNEADCSEQAHWCFEMRDRTNPAVQLGDELQLHLIELPKIDRLAYGGKALRSWVKFFRHWQEEREIMSAVEYEPVQQAMTLLRQLSADEKTRRRAFVRERALRDERSALAAATAKGVAQGVELGVEQALEQALMRERQIIARQLARKLAQSLTAYQQERLDRLSFEQLEKLAEALFDFVNGDDLERWLQQQQH
ncbi:Rpn family recombination-promoting nuclease/putative transposase [Ectothiorhodospiraceae bacterium BW-2]|nr:Rpn family recombination-promoting nuclease/putative transposase [Ectothiorhodospiraceae bacterium BW-2]